MWAEVFFTCVLIVLNLRGLKEAIKRCVELKYPGNAGPGTRIVKTEVQRVENSKPVKWRLVEVA